MTERSSLGQSVIAEIVKLSPQPGDLIVVRFGEPLLALASDDRRALVETLHEDLKHWSHGHPGYEMVLVPPGLEIGLERREPRGPTE